VQVEAGRSNAAALALYAAYGLVAPSDDRVLLTVTLG
jgi:hypothetical protein